MSILSLNAQSKYELATKEYDNGNFQKAIQLYTESIVNNENLYNSHIFRGMSYLFSNDAIKSKEDFNKALGIEPFNPKITLYYAKYNAAIDNYMIALTNYNSYLNDFPDDYEVYSEKAAIEAQLKMTEKAISDCQKALNNSSNNYKIYLNVGYAYLMMDSYDKAIEYSSRSISIKPSHRAYGNRGCAYAFLKNNTLAIKDYLKALEYNPNDPLILFFLGTVYFDIGDANKGCDCYLKSKELGNNQIDADIDKQGCKTKK